MSKWIAEFDLEDSDTMPEHMDLNYMGAKIDFHCRPMWIPVSERLPEEGEEVLVTTEWGSITIGERYSANDYSIYDGAVTADDDEIIAWMPLPEPYEPQESEEV